MGRYVLPLLFLLGLSGCHGLFSKEVMRECDVDVSLPQLLLHSEMYKGRKVLLGGVILTTRHVKGETIIEVL